MCGRFALAPYEDLSTRYAVEGLEQPVPRYNISPGQDVLCILQGRRAGFMFWGVRPYGRSLINARLETVKEKAMFSRLIENGRCIIPATGFYEWDGQKSPYLFSTEGRVMSLAGLVTERNEVMVLTREAQSPVDKVHGRMPCILLPENEDAWLEPGGADPNSILSSTPELEMIPVSKEVNDVRNDGPHLIEPIQTLDSF